MKRASAALRDAQVPVLLGGGLAAWARGGPPTEHDVDLFVRPEHAEDALATLVEAGMRADRPPEGWLLKAWDDDVLVDLIFRPSGGPIDDAHFARADRLEVMAQPMLVASLDDVLATKLLALGEQELDFAPVLELARALREQIDWRAVRAHTNGSPFAAAFFTLVEELGIAEREPDRQESRPHRPVAASTDG
jgi:aminoglycoside-2''-adenylyltransferase